MLVRKKTTKDEAQSERKKLVALFKNQSRELRTALAKAKLSKSYLVLGYKSFEAYLKDIILRARIDMKTDYARKCANAGIVELTIFGEDLIGTMREAVLRVFYENIPKPHWKKVFELAKENSRKPSMYRLLTSKQIIEAAISLKVYEKGEAKSKDTVTDEKTVKNTSNESLLDIKSSNTNTGKPDKPKVNPDGIINPTMKPDKVTTVNSLSSEKARVKIVNSYNNDEIKTVIGYLKAYQDKTIKKRCVYIVNHCNKKAIKNLIKKLSMHVAE